MDQTTAPTREKQIHELKCDTEPFVAAWENRKRAEFRKTDRDFQVGDILILKHWKDEAFTGEKIITTILDISRGYGIPDGYAMISFQKERY